MNKETLKDLFKSYCHGETRKYPFSKEEERWYKIDDLDKFLSEVAEKIPESLGPFDFKDFILEHMNELKLITTGSESLPYANTVILNKLTKEFNRRYGFFARAPMISPEILKSGLEHMASFGCQNLGICETSPGAILCNSCWAREWAKNWLERLK